MSTSNRTVIVVAGEAVAAVATVVIAVAVTAPGDLALRDLGFHPAWIPVVVMAARYGPLGLYVTLATMVGMLVGGSAALGQPLGALADRLRAPSELFALVACLLVAWIAMMHDSRSRRLRRRLAVADAHEVQAEATIAALQDSLTYLRERCDRIDMSLSLWRDLAHRLERGDAADAARAALDLCAIRCGASAGAVLRMGPDGLAQVTRRGATPAANGADRTVDAAVTSGVVVPASDVPGAEPEDSDVAAPVIDESDGTVLGAIALCGVGPGRLRAADLRDLSIVASWLAPALSVAVRKPRLRAVTEETIR